tara:strand:+ start:45 stop:179 length:135 start_codon:yes stop_codon:yes gene_type:complete
MIPGLPGQAAASPDLVPVFYYLVILGKPLEVEQCTLKKPSLEGF